MADTKPPAQSTRTVWTQAKEQQLNELLRQKERAYSEGADAIASILIAAGSCCDGASALVMARELIPVASALREALAPFDEKAQK